MIRRATSGRSAPTTRTARGEGLTRRWRGLRYGAALGLVLVGVACGATIPGTVGGTLATGLIGVGLVGALSLVFYEVGLSEDRDRARDRVPGYTHTPLQPPRPAGHSPAPDRSARPDGSRPATDRVARLRRLGRRRGENCRVR